MFNARVWNIALRTAHIAAMGVLLGGHAFADNPREELLLCLWLTIGTGVALGMLETGGSLVWFHQGRGLMTMAKLVLLCAVPFLWEQKAARLAVLLAVVVIASVGSHMTARLRYYSIVYRKVIYCHDGPGTGRLAAESTEKDDASEDQ